MYIRPEQRLIQRSEGFGVSRPSGHFPAPCKTMPMKLGSSKMWGVQMGGYHNKKRMINHNRAAMAGHKESGQHVSLESVSSEGNADLASNGQLHFSKRSDENFRDEARRHGLRAPPNSFSAKYVPLSPGESTDEEYSLDEIIYRGKTGALLDVQHDLDALMSHTGSFKDLGML